MNNECTTSVANEKYPKVILEKDQRSFAEGDLLANATSLEDIFALKVRADLKEKVNGRIFCKVVDGSLQVSIKQGKMVWRKNVSNVYEQIVEGRTNFKRMADYIYKVYYHDTLARTKKYYFKYVPEYDKRKTYPIPGSIDYSKAIRERQEKSSGELYPGEFEQDRMLKKDVSEKCFG